MARTITHSNILAALAVVAVFGGFFAFSEIAFAATPTVSLSALPQSIAEGATTMLTWSSLNATSCVGVGFSTDNATAGSVSVSPNATKTYSITCTGTAVDTWQKKYVDVTDLWCAAFPPSFQNYYTENECPGNTAPTGACGATGNTCFVNHWQTKEGFSSAPGEKTYCNLITEAYSCEAGGASSAAQASANVTVAVVPTPTPAPTCNLDLTKDNISWATTGANNVVITPLTNSPAVPGASATIPAGTSVFSGDFGAFKAAHAAKFQQDASANGGVTLGNASFKANKATADRLCKLVFPGSVNGTFHTDTFSSPKNNTIAIWNGFLWSIVPGKGNDPHLRFGFTCVTAAPSGGTFALSGSHNFIPPLGVGTHTYKLTATGPGGTEMCQATVIVPPPPPPPPPPAPAPTCNLTLTANKITWQSTNAASVSIVPTTASPLVGLNLALNGFKNFNPFLPSGEHFYKMTVVGTNGDTIFCGQSVIVPPPPPPPGAPFCDLFGTSLPIGSGNSTTIHYASFGMTSFSVNNGVGSLNPITDGAFTVSPAVTTTYTGTANGPSGPALCSWTINVAPPPPPPNAPTANITATPGAIISGDSSSLSWSSTNTTSCTGTNFSTGGATSGSLVVSPTTTTTYSVSCSGPGGTATDSDTVTVSSQGPSCSLSADSTSIDPGDSITLSWTGNNVTSGSINGNVGPVSPASGGSVSGVFPSDDITYIGTFTGPEGTATCSVFVDVDTGGGGGGGGGLNQPTTALLSHPFDAPLVAGAFVSLAQVPYTGFEAGAALTVIFWSAVALFAAMVSYYLVGQTSIQSMLSYVTGLAGVPTEEEIERAGRADERAKIYGPEYPAFQEADMNQHDSAYLQSSAVAMPIPAAAPVAQTVLSEEAPSSPRPQSPVVDGIPALVDVMESRAHAAGILISPEATEAALSLSPDRAEALKIFGDILNQAVQTTPREDGWVMLTKERFSALSEDVRQAPSGMPAQTSVSAPAGKVVSKDYDIQEKPPALTYALGREVVREKKIATPRETAVHEAASSQFAGAVLSGNRDVAFSIVRSFETDGLNPLALMTGTATVLDRIYRLRKGGTNGVDPMLIEKSANVDDDTLHELVTVFAHSLDSTYANPFTGVKLALAQAFEVLR